MSTSAQIPDGFVEVPWTGPVVAFNDELNGRRIVGPGDNVVLPIHQAHDDERVAFRLTQKQQDALQRAHDKRVGDDEGDEPAPAAPNPESGGDA